MSSWYLINVEIHLITKMEYSNQINKTEMLFGVNPEAEVFPGITTCLIFNHSKYLHNLHGKCLCYPLNVMSAGTCEL